MATLPTNLPVPSESPRDLKFNAGKIDEFVTSLVNTYVDRFGNEHYTIEGLRWLAQQAIAQYGWIPVGTFQAGATLTLPNQILKDETDGEYYRWDGTFPKTVPSDSTPSSSGGTGVGAWIGIGDSYLRTTLSTTAGAEMIGYENKLGDESLTVGGALDAKFPNILGSVVAPTTGYKFLSFIHYAGNHDFRYLQGGSVRTSTRNISKTGNATLALAGISKSYTVDTIGYIDITSTDPSDVGYPQATHLKDITFKGNGAATQVGLTLVEGLNYVLDGVCVHNTGIALLFGNVWMTRVTNGQFEGQVQYNGGTSMTFSNCFAKVTNTSVSPGAFRFTNLLYSNLNSLASDGTVRTAYYFTGCYGVTFTASGCEQPARLDTGYGVAAMFDQNNNMTIDSFCCVPKASETDALVSINSGNRLTFKNTQFYFDNTHATDFRLIGANNFIHFEGGSFGSASLPRKFPVVAYEAAASGSVLTLETEGNRYIHRCVAATTAVAAWEPYTAAGSFTPTVAFGGTVLSSGVSSDCHYVKNGNQVTIEGYLIFSALGTGALTITNLPYAAAQLGGGDVPSITYGASTIVRASCLVSRTVPYTLGFQKTVSGSTSALGNGDLTTSSTIRFVITYSIVSDWQ